MPTVDVAKPKDSKWEHIAHQKPYYAVPPPHVSLPALHYLNPRKPTPPSSSVSSASSFTPLTAHNLSQVPKAQIISVSLLDTAHKKPAKSLALTHRSKPSVSTVKKKVRSCPASIADSLSPSCSASQSGRAPAPSTRARLDRPAPILNEEWQLCLECHRHIPIRRGVLGRGGWRHCDSWECSKGLR